MRGRDLGLPVPARHVGALPSTFRPPSARSLTPASTSQTSTGSRRRASSRCTRSASPSTSGCIPSYLDETNIGGASFEVLVEHAATAVEAGLAETVLVTYGSVQLSQMGRRLGTGGRNADAVGADGVRGSLGQHPRRQLRPRCETPHARVRDDTRAAGRGCGDNARRMPRTIRWPSTAIRSPSRTSSRRGSWPTLSTSSTAASSRTAARRASSPPPSGRQICLSKPVYLLGAAHGTTHHTNISQMPDLTVTAAAETGPRAFGMAGITPSDVDVAQLYDSFTITVLLTLEGLGFCAPGESGDFVSDGGLGVGGRLPTNTDGGGLSACHPGMRGMFLIVEAVRQLRGQAGETQVPGARIAVAHGTGGMLSTGATLVFSTELR